MGIKWIFALLALAVLAQLLARWLLSRQFMRRNRLMTPAEILRWRLVNGEIDGAEYQFRLTRLRRLIARGLGKELIPNGKGDKP